MNLTQHLKKFHVAALAHHTDVVDLHKRMAEKCEEAGDSARSDHHFQICTSHLQMASGRLGHRAP